MNAELRDLIFVGALCAALGFAAGQTMPPAWTPEAPPRPLTLSSEGQNALLFARKQYRRLNEETLSALSADRIRLMQECFDGKDAAKRLNEANKKIAALTMEAGTYWDAALNALPPADRRVYLKWYAKNRRFFENALTDALLPPVPDKKNFPPKP